MTGGMTGGMAGGLFILVFMVVWLVALAGWVVAIVEVARIPEHQFRAAGTEKTVWVLVVVLTQVIGALIWYFAKRSEVLAAAGTPSPARVRCGGGTVPPGPITARCHRPHRRDVVRHAARGAGRARRADEGLARSHRGL